jgi:carbon-monoxide dehydrogenase medium subunit
VVHVLRPESTAEALRALDEGGEDTKVIAGGTAVVLMMRNGLVFPEQLVALDRLPGLDRIEIGPDEVRIGALATLRAVERSTELQAALPTLAAAVGLVANHRIRQRATVGGVVCESDYASDPPAVLVTLGAEVDIVSSRGARRVPLAEFLVGYYETVLAPGELVTGIRIPRPSPGARTTYIKFISRSAEDRPCVGIAAHVDIDDGGRCTDVRVAVAGATATPFQVPAATEAVRGAKAADPSTWDAVAGAYRDAISPIGDVRGSAGYRKHVTGELVRRALATVGSGAANGACRL